jgi:hypothetical protein
MLQRTIGSEVSGISKLLGIERPVVYGCKRNNPHAATSILWFTWLRSDGCLKGPSHTGGINPASAVTTASRTAGRNSVGENDSDFGIS